MRTEPIGYGRLDGRDDILVLLEIDPHFGPKLVAEFLLLLAGLRKGLGE